MNSHLVTDLPTIYADMNVFRYVACGDISIKNPNCFRWVYSHVHLDEIHRNGNLDALKGMKMLGATEICDVLTDQFKSVGNIILREYLDPFKRYDEYLEAISGYEDVSYQIEEFLIRIFGADNFEKVAKTPEQMCEVIDRLTAPLDAPIRDELTAKAQHVSVELRSSIDDHLKESMPIDKTRRAMGITSENRKKIEQVKSPIDAIWEIISPSLDGVTKNQFFGFEPMPWVEGIQHTQSGAVASAHLVLNMLGISPDQGLAKREKINNIMSDCQHVGMASYCSALLSADKRFCNKARAIYTYLENVTNPLCFEFKKGLILNLSVVQK